MSNGKVPQDCPHYMRVVNCVRDQQRRPFEITPQLDVWLLESADEPGTLLTKADFDGIRRRARKRNPDSKA